MAAATPSKDEVVAAARRILDGRFPDADAAFVAGSLVRGNGTAQSDIDLVVLFPSLKRAWRESFDFEGRPVEAFVHDAQTVRWFMAKDAEQGRPVMLTMLAEGVIVGEVTDAAEALKREAAEMFARGPAPLDEAALQALRYRVSDLLTDLEDTRPLAETRSIAAALHQSAADLILRGRGQWTGAGKWIPRRLHRLDVGLAARFEAAFEALFTSGDASAAVALLDEELARHGGRLFDGFRQDAPEDGRVR